MTSTLPGLSFWSALFLLLAVAIAAYSGWSLRRQRQRQDLYYLLLGVYLAATQLPAVFPDIDRAMFGGRPVAGSPLGIGLAIPAVALLILGLRAR